MPATKEKKPDQHRSAISRGETILDAKREDAVAMEVAAWHLLVEIEDRVKGELTPDSVLLSPREEHLLKMGEIEFSSIHELLRLLERVRAAKLSHRVFSFDKLAKARQDVAEAKERLRTEQAQIGDLEEVADTTEPVLVEQIKNLQSRLDELRKEVWAAEYQVNILLSHQALLDDLAPQCIKKMRDQRNLELHATQEHRTLNQLCNEIHDIEALLLNFEPGGCFADPHSWKALVPYLVQNGVIQQPEGPVRTIDREVVARHLKHLRESKLPELRLQRDKAQTAFDEVEARIDPYGPILAWVEHGTVSIDDLQQ